MQSINNLNEKEFVNIFKDVFEKTQWIAEKAYTERPFIDFSDLIFKMINIFENTTKENQLKIIKHHPDLANKIKISDLSSFSKKEQQDSMLDNCTKDEYNQFNSLNKEYKKKFGFPFILAITNKTKFEILKNFKFRLNSNSVKEFNEAKNQVKKIATIRLKNLELKNNYI